LTRVNVGIHPKELNRDMLIAEHREIKRIPNAIKSGRFSMKGQPKEFKLNDGHVKFFYDKLAYIKKRYELIYRICIERNYDVTYFGDSFVGIPVKYMGDYQPTQRDRKILIQRINERLVDSKQKEFVKISSIKNEKKKQIRMVKFLSSTDYTPLELKSEHVTEKYLP
jgi:deoxyribonuclease (pyrimidine dimer)